MESLSNNMDTTLKRCLGTVHMTFICLGSMVGSGIYIMTGIAAKEMAGKSGCCCFVIGREMGLHIGSISNICIIHFEQQRLECLVISTFVYIFLHLLK